jgi:hypothetical protein
MPSADSHHVMGSPYGSLTRPSICCCMPIFVSPPPCRVSFDGGQDAMTHRRRGFVLPVLPHSPVIFSAVSTSETQRASRGKHRLLSAHDRQIYVVWPCDGYRALSCVADSPRPYPASNLPALYLSVRGNACACVPLLLAGYVDPRFCLRLPSSVHCCNTLAFNYPSPPSDWVWTLSDTRVIISNITI